jgi:putative selenium metabolism hydrolase
MLKTVKNYEEEWVRFTQSLVKIPSVTGTEEELAEFLLKHLKDLDISEAFTDEAGNVVGVIRGNGKGPNVMLNSHLDTVPSGIAANWSPYGPFDAAIDGDRNIFGLGVSDLKAGMAVHFYIIKSFQEALKQKKLTLPGDLVFTAVVHEEAAEMLGMEYLMEKTMPKHNIKCDLVFLAEPTSNDLALGHRGKIEIVVKTQGKTAHSSQPKLGINALEKMLPVMDTVFHRMSDKLKADPVLGESSITITNCTVKPGALSIVPDECEISIDRRYMPGEELDDILEDFKEIFKKIQLQDKDFKATVEPRIFTENSYTGYEKAVKKYHPPWKTDKNLEFVKKTFSALQASGQAPAEKYWKFGTDGSMSAGIYGIPTIGYSGAEEKWAHQPNERVNIDEMLKTFDGYLAIICQIMGLDKNIFN